MKHDRLLISIIAALMMISTALWLKDTEYENAWIYILSAYFFLIAALDIYSAYSKKKKR